MQIHEDYKNDIAVAAINSNDADNYPDDSFENMEVRAGEKLIRTLSIHNPDIQCNIKMVEIFPHLTIKIFHTVTEHLNKIIPHM